MAYLAHWVACGFEGYARGAGFDPNVLVGTNPALFASVTGADRYVYSVSGHAGGGVRRVWDPASWLRNLIAPQAWELVFRGMRCPRREPRAVQAQVSHPALDLARLFILSAGVGGPNSVSSLYIITKWHMSLLLPAKTCPSHPQLYWAVTTLAGNEWNDTEGVDNMVQIAANAARAGVFLLFNLALGEPPAP